MHQTWMKIEDVDDTPLVRPACQGKQPPKEKSGLDTDDEDLLPLVPPRLSPVAPVRKKKGHPSVASTQLLQLEREVAHRTRASEQKIPHLWGQKSRR